MPNKQKPIDEESCHDNKRHSLQMHPTQLPPNQNFLRPTQSHRNLEKRKGSSYIGPATIPEEDSETLQIVNERNQITFIKRNDVNRESKMSTTSARSVSSLRRNSTASTGISSGYDNAAFEGSLSKSVESITAGSAGPSTRDPSITSLT